MNNKKYFFKTGNAGFVSNTVFLMALAGCVSYAEGQNIRISVPVPEVVVRAPVIVAPPIVVDPPIVVASPEVVVAQDNYVYYPSYGIYYNTSRHQYAYQDGGAWVSAAAPIGVSADVLLASPSVKMDFHDSPSHHHADMVHKYPNNYKADHSDRKEDRKDGDRDGHDRK